VATGTVRAQREVDAKTNEIPELAPAVAHLDLTGQVVTLDALCRRRHNASYEDPVVMPMPPSGAVSVVAAGRTAGGIITGTRGTPRGRPGAGSVRS
jgi:predicted transposase YbfD/YdcC